MKKSNKILCLINVIIITIGVPSNLLSQFGPGISPGGEVYGYVLLNNGDTLKGLVKWRVKYIENNLAEIKFTSKNGNSKIFNASDIHGFGHYKGLSQNAIESPEDENYESIPSLKNGIPVFIYRFLDGRIKVFQHRNTKGMFSHVESSEKIDGISFRFEPGEGLFIEPSYKTSYKIIASRSYFSSYLVSKDNGNLLEVNKNNYGKVIPVLFGDCPRIEKEIEKNSDLAGFKYFMMLTEVYNHICNGSSESH